MVCFTKMRMHMLYLLIFYMYSQKLLDTRYCAFIKVTEECHFLQEIFRWCPFNNIGRHFKSIPSPSNENYSHEPSSNIIWQGGLQSNNFKPVLWQKHKGTGLPGCLVVETLLILTNQLCLFGNRWYFKRTDQIYMYAFVHSIWYYICIVKSLYYNASKCQILARLWNGPLY